MRYIDWVCLPAALLAFACGAHAQSLQLLTTEVPPLAFTKDGKVQGFCVDVVADLQRRLHMPGAITSLPWARAYHLAQVEPNVVLVCPKRTAERENKFQWVGPLLESQTGLYVRTGTRAKLATLDAAKGLSNILVVRASYAYQLLAEGGFHNLYEVNDATGMVRMLMADRAPAMMLERGMLDAVLADVGIERDAISTIYEMPSPSSNLAFSLQVPAPVVKQWQAAFDAMKKDGSYGKLYEKWFPAPGTGTGKSQSPSKR